MKIGEFKVMIASLYYEDELVAEIRKKKTDTRDYEVGSVHIEDGKPMIHLVPNEMDENGEWVIAYSIFRRIVKELDDFLESIGHSVDSRTDP